MNADPAKNSAEHFEPVRRELSASLVGDQFERYFVAFAQLADTRALDGADMDESILGAIIRRNKAKAFFGVKPLHGSLWHENPFFKIDVNACQLNRRPSKSRFQARCFCESVLF
ncbi:hypothetical protein [Rhodoblastus sp. 17X3]|uniref:hypothetical protein n=1 Tax=Rhodoblastus sp. 17X3 TaxID=3047026 RepID=UPI00406C8C45